MSSGIYSFDAPLSNEELEMGRVLGLIDAEWRSDPTSVQCFDLCLVEDVRKAVANFKVRKAAHDQLIRREMRRRW